MATKVINVEQESQLDIETSSPFSGDMLEFWPSAYSGRYTTYDLTTNTIMVAGCHVWYYGTGGYSSDQDWPLFVFRSSSNSQVELILTNGLLWVRDGNGANLGGLRTHLQVQTWMHIEMKAYCHSSNGYVVVRVNGSPALTINDVNTNNAGTGYFTRFSYGDATPLNGFQITRVDNLYVCDGSGSKNNDFLGPVTVHTIFPDGDDSVNFATTGNANYATHYQQVNSSDAMWTTDYVQDSTTGNRDIFTMDDTLNFSTVHGIMGCIVTLGITSNQNYTQVFSSNGTELESSNMSANTSTNKTSYFVVEDDPDTSSDWTSATINALKFGIELQ
jgi:hypothetical protein